MRKHTVVYVFIVLAILVGGLFAVLAITSPTPVIPSSNTSVEPAPAPRIELPMVNLDGEWSAENNGSKFVAMVTDSNIEIRFVADDTSMIYWNGTFQTEAAPNETILSTKVDNGKMVLSKADSKNFVVGTDSLSFEFEAMGVIKTVAMTRV